MNSAQQTNPFMTAEYIAAANARMEAIIEEARQIERDMTAAAASGGPAHTHAVRAAIAAAKQNHIIAGQRRMEREAKAAYLAWHATR